MKNKVNKPRWVSPAVIERLPQYCHELTCMKEEGIIVTSSEKLAQRLGASPEQVRKDFTYFGAFGRKGVGYIVETLLDQLRGIVGLDKSWNLAIVGIGHLGTAIANYSNFKDMGFKVSHAFDADSTIIGKQIGNLVVEDIADLKESLAKNPVQIGVITTPSSVAQLVADQLVEAGVKGIWLFAPVRLQVPEHIKVVQADLLRSISVLAYHLNN